jgi:hypothetical protein
VQFFFVGDTAERFGDDSAEAKVFIPRTNEKMMSPARENRCAGSLVVWVIETHEYAGDFKELTGKTKSRRTVKRDG